MTVAVVAVSYCSAEDISGLIDALIGQDCHDFSIHVCENGGAPAFERLVAEIAGRFGEVRRDSRPSHQPQVEEIASARIVDGIVVELLKGSANHGYAGGVNACIRALEGGAWSSVWVINPDARPASGALGALLVRQAEGDYGIVGGKLVFSETGRVQAIGGIWRKWIARGLNLGFGEDVATRHDAGDIERRMDYVSGACMLVSRSFIEAIGLMREDYFLYCEEVDWCARRGGFRLGYAADALIDHGHGATIGSHRNRRKRSRLAVYLDERNRLLFTRNIHPAIFPVVAGIALVLLLQYVKAGAFTNFRHALAGWWAGIRGLEGPPPWMQS